MSYTERDICDSFNSVERHDVNVFRIFVHPDDLPKVEEFSYFEGGDSVDIDGAPIRGRIFGAGVVPLQQIKKGDFDIAACPGYNRHILKTCDNVIAETWIEKLVREVKRKLRDLDPFAEPRL